LQPHKAAFASLGQSVLDPWNPLPVRRVLSASYMVYDMTLGHGKIIDQLSWLSIRAECRSRLNHRPGATR